MTSIFLSYARDDDEPFVRRLHHDLVAAGFRVWFDRESMPSRSLTFQHEVREAVAVCDRLLLVVGPHSMASDFLGQEWQFAYFAANKCVNPIVRLDGTDAAGRRIDGYRLLPEDLRLLHAEDFRDDAQYAGHLAQLVRQLSEPLPPVGKLVAVPELPPGYRAQPERLRALRDMLLIDLRAPVVVSGAAARLGLQGMAGIGKSVLANALAHHPEVQRAFRDNIFWLKLGQQPQVEDLQRWLARQLGDPGHFADRYTGKETLRRLLADRAVLLILDDVWNREDAEAFNIAGPRGRLLLTTRDAGLVTALAARENHYRVELPSAAEAEALLGAAADVAPAALPPAAHQIIARTGRLPLALALCGGLVRAGTPWHHVLEALQEHDLEFLSADHPAEEQHRNAWVAMDISLRALPQPQRERFAELSVFALGSGVPEAAIATLWQHTGGLSARQTARLLGDFTQRTLVLRTAAGTADADAAGAITLHDLLHNFAEGMALKRHRTLAALHRLLLDAYRARCPNGWTSGPDDGYFLQKLCSHLLAAGETDKAVELLDGLAWVAATCKAGLVFEVLADYRQTIDTLPEAQQELEQERRQRARLTRWSEELTDYARQWSRRRDIEAQTGQPVTDPEPKLPEPPATCRMWTEEEIAAECTRLLEQPKRLDRLQAFEGFVRAQCYRLLDHGRRDGFVGQHALAQFPSGPVYTAAQALLADCKAPVLLRRWPPGSVANPKPALFATLEGHRSGVFSVGVTSDGRRAVSGSEDGTLRVWDVETGRQRTLDEHCNSVESVSVTPDGQRAVLGGSDKTLRVWDLVRGACLRTLEHHGHTVSCVSMTPDGRRAVSCSGYQQTLWVWDLVSGVCLRTLRDPGHVSCVAVTGDGRRAVSCSECRQTNPGFSKSSGGAEMALRVWDLNSGVCLHTLEAHCEDVLTISVTPDGRRAVSASFDNTLRVWDLHDGVCLRTLAGHSDMVFSVSSTPDGRRAVSGSFDNTLRVWDLDTGACLRTFKDSVGATGVSLTSDGRRALSWDRFSDSLHIWDLERGSQVPGRLASHHKSGSLRNVEPYVGRAVFWGNATNTLRFLDLGNKSAWYTLSGHGTGVRCAAVTPGGRRAVSSSDDDTLRVWDVESGGCLRVFQHSGFRCVAMTPDGRRAVGVLTGHDNTLQVWDIDGGTCLSTLRGHKPGIQYSVDHVTVTPDGRCGVSACTDNTLQVWDLGSGTCLRKVEIRLGYEADVTITPDGRRAVAGCFSLEIWNLGSGTCHKTVDLGVRREPINCKIITPDGQRAVVVHHADHAVRVWDLDSGECLGVYCGNSPMTHGLDQTIVTCGGGVLDIRGISPGPAVLTMSNKGQTRCTVCGAAFQASRAIVTTIDNLCVHLAPSQSPCLELPESAFSDPRLLSQCPRCNSPVKFNPFFVDAVADCSVRKPESEWKRLSDLDPELVEFEHLMCAERFDDACRLLNEIDREYLAFWGQRALVVELRTRLIGRIVGARLQSLNYGNLGATYLEMGEGEKSVECLGRGLAIARELGERPLECRWMGNLGIALLAGDGNDGRRKLEDALALANEIDDPLHIGRWTYKLCECFGGSDTEACVQTYLSALAATRVAHDRRFERYCLSAIGAGLVKLDRAAEATPYLREAVTVAETIGDTRGLIECLFALAGCHESAGDYESQAASLQQAADVAHQLGDRLAWGRSISRLRSVQKRLGCDVPETTRW